MEIDGGGGAFLPSYQEKMWKIESSLSSGECMYALDTLEIFTAGQQVKHCFIQVYTLIIILLIKLFWH